MDFFSRVREIVRLRGTTIEGMMTSLTPNNMAAGDIYTRDTYNGWRRRNILPRANIAVEIANYLDVSVEYLVTGQDHNPHDDFYSKFFKYKDLLEKYDLLSPANKRLIESSVVKLAEK